MEIDTTISAETKNLLVATLDAFTKDNVNDMAETLTALLRRLEHLEKCEQFAKEFSA
jgi:hypothetical protein